MTMGTRYSGGIIMIFHLAVVLICGGLAHAYLLFSGRIFLLSLLGAFYVYAIARGAYYIGGHFGYWLAGGISTLVIYFVVITLSMFGSGAYEMLGPNPPAFIILMGLYVVLRGSILLVDDLAGDTGASAPLKLVVGGAVFVGCGILVFYGLFNGSWATAGDLVGGAGYGVEQAVDNVGGTLGTGWERFTASLSPSNNPNIARIACTFEAGLGGGMNPQQGAGSVAIQACVREKLGQNRSTAESEQVTEPVEVRVEEVQVEPFPGHLRVVLPITNTLVYDRRGRVINMTARDVSVDTKIKYLGTEVASAAQEDMRIPNGDTRTIEFNQAGSGYIFPLFQYIDGDIQPDVTIQRNFQTIKSDCNGGNYEEESDSCKSAVNYFLEDGNGDFRSDRFQPKRIAFLVKANDDIAIEDLPYVRSHIEEHLSENLIAPGNEYEIEVEVNYTYSAEAAFTESSRWRSGNLLLKVWNSDAWNEQSFDERQSWENQNCGTVKRFAQEFTKQRTAALTTPIVPVMYTDCSSTLFRLIDDEDDNAVYDGDIEINVGATVKGHSVDQDHPIGIEEAVTTCGNDNTNDLTSEGSVQKTVPDTITHQEGAGWAVDPGIVSRSVEVAGQSISIGCNVEMTFNLTVDRTTTYEVPAFEFE